MDNNLIISCHFALLNTFGLLFPSAIPDLSSNLGVYIMINRMGFSISNPEKNKAALRNLSFTPYLKLSNSLKYQIQGVGERCDRKSMALLSSVVCLSLSAGVRKTKAW